MAATYTLTRPTPNPDAVVSNRKKRVRDIAFSGTYTTGGDALLPSAFGLKVFDELTFHNGSVSDGTVSYPVVFIPSSNKVKLFESGGAAGTAAAEKGSAESLTSITGRATAIGF